MTVDEILARVSEIQEETFTAAQKKRLEELRERLKKIVGEYDSCINE